MFGWLWCFVCVLFVGLCWLCVLWGWVVMRRISWGWVLWLWWWLWVVLGVVCNWVFSWVVVWWRVLVWWLVVCLVGLWFVGLLSRVWLLLGYWWVDLWFLGVCLVSWWWSWLVCLWWLWVVLWKMGYGWLRLVLWWWCCWVESCCWWWGWGSWGCEMRLVFWGWWGWRLGWFLVCLEMRIEIWWGNFVVFWLDVYGWVKWMGGFGWELFVWWCCWGLDWVCKCGGWVVVYLMIVFVFFMRFGDSVMFCFVVVFVFMNSLRLLFVFDVIVFGFLFFRMCVMILFVWWLRLL